MLPASFLEESYSDSEIITITTVDQEQYTCVLPDLTGESAPKVHFRNPVFFHNIESDIAYLLPGECHLHSALP